jgi:hypothetical protein
MHESWLTNWKMCASLNAVMILMVMKIQQKFLQEIKLLNFLYTVVYFVQTQLQVTCITISNEINVTECFFSVVHDQQLLPHCWRWTRWTLWSWLSKLSFIHRTSKVISIYIWSNLFVLYLDHLHKFLPLAVLHTLSDQNIRTSLFSSKLKPRCH